jgi:hypothetical protein
MLNFISGMATKASFSRGAGIEIIKDGYKYHAHCPDFPILDPLPKTLHVLPANVMQRDDRLTPKIPPEGNSGW